MGAPGVSVAVEREIRRRCIACSSPYSPPMAAFTAPLLHYQTTLSNESSKSRFVPLVRTVRRSSSKLVVCSSSNGRTPSGEGVEQADRGLEEKRWKELSSRIASGEFTVGKSGRFSGLRQALTNFGGPGEVLGDLLLKYADDGSGIPEARGDVRSIRDQPFFIPLYSLFLTYGGIFRLTFGPKSFIIVSDPSIAKHILRENSKSYSKGILGEILDFVMGKGLIPADGEIWRVRRRAIVPAMHKRYVEAMISLFGQASDRLCQKLDAAAQDGEDVEMEALFSRLTLDIIGKAVFNYELDSLTNDTGIVEAVYTLLREAENRSTAVVPYWKIPIWKDISPYLRKVTKALTLVNNTLDELIAICKKMVEDEETEFHEEYMNEQDPSILHFLLASGDDVSSKQLRDDLMTMLIAGHETSAAVLTWTFYLLSKEPHVMEKLQNEVDCVLGDRFPTIDDMKNLKYTMRVINESMRLYPQPPVLVRRALEDDTYQGYRIKRGEDVFISVWNLHRSPHIWVDEEKFNPERWPVDGPNPNEINQDFSYLPFGGGPRKCIGDMFATYEVMVAIAMLVRRFNFELAPGAPPVGMTTGATIHTTEGLTMSVTRRMKSPVIPSLEVNMRAAGADLTAGNPSLDEPASVGVTEVM